MLPALIYLSISISFPEREKLNFLWMAGNIIDILYNTE